MLIIKEKVGSCTGDDWATIAEKINRFAFWEFSDYKE